MPCRPRGRCRMPCGLGRGASPLAMCSRVFFAVCPCCFADLRGHTLYGIFAGVWKVELEPIADWLNTLDHKSRVQILAAVSLLEEQGPDLKRPIVGKIKGSSLIPSMKELRPGSSGRSEIRILFAFDPKRKAIMLVGGDKQRKWDKWYRKAIPEAERRYLVWLEERYGKETDR